MLHTTIVALSCLVEKVPSQELFSAQSLSWVWYDRFSGWCWQVYVQKQNCSLWLTSFPVAVSNLKYYLLPEVCVSNYTEDTEDICSCVKLHWRYLFTCKIIQSYLFMCQIWNNYLLPKLSLATNIYHASTHSVTCIYYYL